MPMVPFHSRFPDLAKAETRTVALVDEAGIGPRYAFVDLYCNEPDCDCRIAFINVYPEQDPDPQRPLAIINYGWEPLAHYVRWSRCDAEEAARIKGPGLHCAMFGPKGPLALQLVELFRDLLRDPEYVARLKRDDRLFRESVEAERGPAPVGVPRGEGRIGRNDPCACGSGKKRKRCCGAR